MTDDLRGQIKSELLKGKFDKDYEPLYVEAAELARNCYDRLFSVKQRSSINDLPEGWLPVHDKIIVKFGYSGTQDLHFNGLSRFLRWRKNDDSKAIATVNMRYPQRFMYMHPHLDLPKDDKLTKQFLSIKERNDALKKKEEDLEKEIKSVLYSASTTGKLITVWPEIEPTVKKFAPIDRPLNTLPAKVLTNLNEQLGLKKVAA
jgi:hypothetical protein